MCRPGLPFPFNFFQYMPMSTTLSPDLPPFTVEQMVKLKRAHSVALSPCGRWAALALERLSSDGSEWLCDLWRIPLDKNGPPQQLTNGKSRDTNPSFRADGALGFLSNRADTEVAGTNENGRRQIWLLPAHGGEPMRLSDEPLGVAGFKFAARGNRLAFLTEVWPGVAAEQQRAHDDKIRKAGPSALHYKQMTVRYWDRWLPNTHTHLIVCEQDGSARCDLTPELDADSARALLNAEFDLSEDGRQVAVTWASPGADKVTDIALKIFDLSQEGAGRVLAAEALCEASAPRFAPDGSKLAYLCKARLPHRAPQYSLRLLDLQGGQNRRLAADWDAWPRPAAWTQDGKSLYVLAEEAGAVAIFAVELETNDVVRLTHSGSHDQVQHAAHGEFLIGLRSAIGHPPEVFMLTCNDSAELCLPAPLSGFLASQIPHQLQNIQVAADDGAMVQSWLLKPPGEGPFPTLLWVHGGPINAWNDAWHWRWNPLLAVAEGYAVMLPNPRGSTGFGQKFVDGIWGNVWGAQCYRDVMAVVDHVAQMEEIDATRMAAMGGSFGGYMTNWIGTQTDRFRCLITHASVYALSNFHGGTDDPAYWMLEMDESPYSDPVAFDRYSPSRYVVNWKAPALIIHGDKDYRVSINESLALFAALQHHGVPSELLVFPDENHWILKPNNSIVWYQSVFKFLHTHLRT